MPVLDLGSQPLANALLRPEDLDAPEPRYPLTVVFCPSCSLLQITETVSPEELFRNYVYFSSVSNQTVERMGKLAERVTREYGLGGDSLVAEIASNDGYLLRHYKALGIPVVGIEPARNIARLAEEQVGIPTIPEFFDQQLAEQMVRAGQRADVIHANNVLAHVADLRGVVAGIQILLKPTGVAIIEAPYVGDLVERAEFDTIYHEHLCYFSLSALSVLFRFAELQITHVEHLPDHGGSLRTSVQHAGAAAVRSSVTELLAAERASGILDVAYYRTLAARSRRVRERLPALLGELRASCGSLAAYGAAAKGSTLLNYCGIGVDLLDYVVDRSPHKQGLYMPGVRLPIEPADCLVERQPSAVLLLSWNFAREIMRQQHAYLQRGGRFIVPVPEPAVIGGPDAEN